MAGCTRRAMRRNPNGTDVLVNEAGARGGVFAGGARGSHVAGLARRALAASLSALLAFSLVPAQAWAGEAAAVSEAAPVEEEASDSESGGAPAQDTSTDDVDAATEGEQAEVTAPAEEAAPEQSSSSSAENSANDDDIVSASIEIVGVDAAGATETWLPQALFEIPAGSTAADLTELAFEYAGIEADYDPDGSWGWVLNTITSPTDPDLTLGYDAATGAYWQLFVNGESSQLGAGSVELHAGDVVAWCYTADAEPPTSEGDVSVDPDATRPDWDATWQGSSEQGGMSSPVTAPTPTEGAELSWSVDYHKYSSATYPSASEPVIAGSYIYLAVDKTLVMFDKATGAEVRTAPMAASISYTCRPVYTRGLVIVPLGNGRVQAFSAESLACVWVTEPVSDLTQSSCTIALDGDYIIVETVDIATDPVTWASTYSNGTVTRINIDTGAISWRHVNAGEGYYWSGAAVTDEYIIVSTSAGTVEVLSKYDGSVVSSTSVGAIVNAECLVSSDGSRVYVFSTDGTMHVLALGEDGSLGAPERVDVGLTGCAGGVTVDGDTVYVGGSVQGASALAIIDLVARTAQLVTEADGAPLPEGGVKGAPLVSKQDDGTYVYFTVNYAETTDHVHYTAGGGVYRYKLGDASAELIWDAKGYEGFCDSPVICDSEGNLYYINDSGHLMALRAGTGGGTSGGSGVTGGSGTGGTPTGTHGAGLMTPLGTVAPAATPLGDSEEAAADAAEAEAVATSADEAGGAVATRMLAAPEESRMNPWAIAGVVAGIVGIAAIGLFLGLGKRQGGR